MAESADEVRGSPLDTMRQGAISKAQKGWWPQGNSNPRFGLERAAS